jgi:CheY-like chemotaxis protein
MANRLLGQMVEMPALVQERMTANPSSARKTILVVDDEPAVLELVDIILTRQGYRVLTAVSGPKALDTCGRHPGIDLLLTDVMMPEMSGFALVRGIQDLKPDLPVLYMTGGTLNGLVDDELDSQCNLLRKPFDPQTLVRTVEGVLSARSER